MDEKEQNNSKFKAIPVTGSSSYEKAKKVHSGFGKSVMLPFVSGIVGCTVVIGTCFGVPSIRTKIIGSTGTSSISTTNNSSTNNTTNKTVNNTTNTTNTTNNTSNTLNTSALKNSVNTTATTNTSYNNTTLPKTGIGNSTPVVVLITIFGISAVYAYKKIRDYKSL